MKTRAEITQREDRRVAQRQADILLAERKLFPVITTVCAMYRVVPEDIIASHNVHPDVVMARNIITYLGWSRCKIGPTILSAVLCKQRSDTSAKIIRLKKIYAAGDSFARQVDAVVRRIEAFPG